VLYLISDAGEPLALFISARPLHFQAFTARHPVQAGRAFLGKRNYECQLRTMSTVDSAP
jgi:hypothetical protein